jgi:hypothetical protein
MGIMLQLTPTSENSTKSNLLITGTDIQLDIFKRAIKVREVAVRDGNVGLALEAKVRQFFCLQRLRLPV